MVPDLLPPPAAGHVATLARVVLRSFFRPRSPAVFDDKVEMESHNIESIDNHLDALVAFYKDHFLSNF